MSRWLSIGLVLFCSCSSEEYLPFVAPEGADFLALASIRGTGVVEHSSVRSAQSGLLFESHPLDFEEVRVLAWREFDFRGLTVDETELLSPDDALVDPLPAADVFRINVDGTLTPVNSTDRVTSVWWRQRPDPCRGFVGNEFRADLALAEVYQTASRAPVRQLVVGRPNEAPGTVIPALHDVGPVVSYPATIQTLVPTVDIAWGTGQPYYVMLEDGRVWGLTEISITSTQTLGLGELEEGPDGTVIFISAEGTVLRLEGSGSQLWTQTPGVPRDIAVDDQRLAAIIDSQVLEYRDGQWQVLGPAEPQSRLTMIESGVAVTRPMGYTVYYDDGVSRSGALPFDPVDLQGFGQGFVAVGGTEGVAVWRPGLGSCFLPLNAGNFTKISGFAGRSAVNFFSDSVDAAGRLYGGSVLLDGL